MKKESENALDEIARMMSEYQYEAEQAQSSEDDS